MTSWPGERRFYAELLTLLGAPQRPRADIAQTEQAAFRIMEAIGVQVLVIDEVHNILAGTYREQRIVLNSASSDTAAARDAVKKEGLQRPLVVAIHISISLKLLQQTKRDRLIGQGE